MISQCSNNLVLGGKREFESGDLVEIRGTTSANAFRVRKERIVRAVRGQEIRRR